MNWQSSGGPAKTEQCRSRWTTPELSDIFVERCCCCCWRTNRSVVPFFNSTKLVASVHPICLKLNFARRIRWAGNSGARNNSLCSFTTQDKTGKKSRKEEAPQSKLSSRKEVYLPATKQAVGRTGQSVSQLKFFLFYFLKDFLFFVARPRFSTSSSINCVK